MGNAKIEELLEIFHQGERDKVFSQGVLGLRFADGTEQIHTINALENAVFDVASVTKSIPLATLALRLILLGKIRLEDPIIQWIPELQNDFRDQVQVWHLLTHSLDYRFPMSSLKDLPASQILERLFKHNYREAPGSSFSYGNAASILLGIVLERFTGESLPAQAQKHFFDPLNMQDTGWFPLHRGISQERIIATEECPWRGKTMRGEVHDESAFSLQKLGAVGSAGLFSTVPDLMRFMDMILQDGNSPLGRILPQGVLSMVTQNALPNVNGQGTALGWELENRRFMGEVCSSRTFGKTGFTGSCVIADADRQMALVLLTNFTWPQREATVERIYSLRRTLANVFFA